MKKMMLLFGLFFLSQNAIAKESHVFNVSSKNNFEYTVELGIEAKNKNDSSRAVVIAKELISKVAKEETVHTFLIKREDLFKKLNKELEKENINLESISLLRLKIENNKVVDIL